MAAKHSTRRFSIDKRRALTGVAFVLFVVLCLRIWLVNQARLIIPEQHSPMQEDVELAGNFIFDNQENTDGYSIRVDAAEVMDASKYVERYGKATSASPETGAQTSGDVLVLTYTVTNKGNGSGWLDMVMLMAVGSSKNHLYKVDGNLWKIAEPSLESSSALILSPNSTYTTQLPMSFSEGPGLFESMLGDETQTRSSIPDRDFSLYVSNAPVRKIIDIHLT